MRRRTVRCNALVVVFYPDKRVPYWARESHTIRYAEAFGRVRIHQNQNTALSEKAIYEPSIGKITLVGRPSLLVYPEHGGSSTQLSFGGLMDSPKDKKVPIPHQSQIESKKTSGS